MKLREYLLPIEPALARCYEDTGGLEAGRGGGAGGKGDKWEVKTR